MTDFEVHDTGTHAALSEQDLKLANAEAMVRRATKLIEDLMPGIGQTVVNVGELNDWLLASREYNRGK